MDSFQYPGGKVGLFMTVLQTAQYRASCKEGAMPVLDSWYRTEDWRGTGIVQPQS